MAGYRQIRPDFHPAGAVSFRIEPAHRRRGRDACSPYHGGCIDPSVFKLNTLRIAFGDQGVCLYFHAAARKRAQRIVRTARRKCWQQTRSRFHQHNARGARIDAAKIGGKRLSGNLRDRTGHLDAGSPATHDHKSQQAPLLLFILRQLGAFKGNQDAATDARRVLDAFQSWRKFRPFVVTEVGMRRTRCDDEVVVGYFAILCLNHFLFRVDTPHFLHQYGGVALGTQNVTDRPGNVSRRQSRGGHLIKQRLEAMMIVPVDDDYIGCCTPERLSCFKPAKAGPDDHNSGLRRWHDTSAIGVLIQCRLMHGGCQASGEALAIRATNSCEVRRMATHNLLLISGDGIGPEVMAEVRRVIDSFNEKGPDRFNTEEALVGGCCYDAHGVAITDATMEKAKSADAVIFGAVGGPKWDKVPYDVRPEAGLLRLRKDLALFANIRPAIVYPALADSSSLKREVVEGLDIIILRELTGGVYFGEPKTITDLGNGQKRAIDTQVYDTYEIERIGRVACELARKRRNKVTSMEKRNVMKTGVVWNEVMTQMHGREFKDVQLEHMLADAGGMQLVRWPKQFDVIVTDNLFGDVLSDIAATLTGSLGMLPSASLGEVDPKTGKRKALYEPVHGSAPDIAGKGIANPIAMIASFGMALRYSFNLGKQADWIDQAISAALAKGLRTADIKSEGTKVVTTSDMGSAILAELERFAA